MRVLITAGAHFAITRDGAFWIQNASMGYALWARYLEVFDEVQLLVGRGRTQSCPRDGPAPVGPGSTSSRCPIPWAPGDSRRTTRGSRGPSGRR